VKTYSEARARLRWYQGRYIDFDGWYGYQCADLAVDPICGTNDGVFSYTVAMFLKSLLIASFAFPHILISNNQYIKVDILILTVGMVTNVQI
jgi:hypothetical protein